MRFHMSATSQGLPVHAPSLVSIAQLEKLGSNFSVGFESVDDHIVDLIPPDQDIAPNAKAVPLIWSPQSPRLHDVLYRDPLFKLPTATYPCSRIALTSET